jgi:hypothetical protein
MYRSNYRHGSSVRKPQISYFGSLGEVSAAVFVIMDEKDS